ncbi:MAG TPA: signal peptidase II [Gemmatimonadaceae bacterium]|nr:signal peptidase II [Gemmatimonadaceae bacterium]
MQRSNSGLFWPVLVVVAAVDALTKALAVSRLLPQRLPHDVYGELVRFTLVYNPGAAFGLHVGQYSRWIFMVLTLVALLILGRLYYSTKPGDVIRTLSLALVCGGALGNLIDRVRSPLGVVDFIDIGFGDSRWPTFNVADMAVSLGAFLLAWVLWGEDTEPQQASVPAPVAVTSEPRELS